MPLVDDRARGREPRVTPRWPWILVAAGFALVWLIVSVLVSLWPRLGRPDPASPPAVRRLQSAALQRAESMAQWIRPAGSRADWTPVLGELQLIDESLGMATYDKHRFLRLAAEAYTATGEPAKGARYYERYLAWGLEVRRAECRQCHSASPPQQPADMLTSGLGTGYVDALRAAKRLRSRRAELLAERKRGAPRTLLLLSFIERELGDEAAASSRAKALRRWQETAAP